MDKKIDSRIKKFISTVAHKNFGFLKAYIFGSYINGYHRPESDIDIALIFEKLEDPDKFDKQVELILLASKFDSRIEAHPLSLEDLNSGNPFVQEIKKTGIEISLKDVKNTHTGF